MRLLSVVVLSVALFAVPSVASAAPYCQAGVNPTYSLGFRALNDALDGFPGRAMSCEFGDPNGTGDTLQITESGLMFYRKSTNIPTFTNGDFHAAIMPTGRVVYWNAPTIDPPQGIDCSIYVAGCP